MVAPVSSTVTYVALAGILLIFALAVVVGIVDARTAERWRRVAAT